ncbi:substrate-binding domain-containing protein [Ideonella livida]|uniref:Substrate-binding domain-containing protein n=1 Tax=Ideonella livida TaxID=2707176 RepID=A0A7C9PHD0_9BURK|nr:substrate-binding domain-containing protein [Ideonella livida]NDY92017.1 substrate-binding domain-containing protein [Ideonella livida]
MRRAHRPATGLMGWPQAARRVICLIGAAVAAAVLAWSPGPAQAAATPGQPTAAAAGARPLRIAFVSHAPNSDTWWNVIRNALKDGAADFNAQVDYLNPADGSIDAMAEIISKLGPDRYDAVAATVADLGKLKGPLSALAARGLPLVTVNSGTTDDSVAVKALLHIGQPEYLAGLQAGQRAAKAGHKKFVCLNHFSSVQASHERCAGFHKGLTGQDSGVQELVLDGSPEAMRSTIDALLQGSNVPTALLALGTTSALPAMAALRALPAGQAVPMLYTFDLSAEITEGIRKGLVGFAIDQQPYAQGYLSVAYLAEYLRMGRPANINTPKYQLYTLYPLHQRMGRYGIELKPSNGRDIQSGPGFVTRLNLDKVERYSGSYR